MAKHLAYPRASASSRGYGAAWRDLVTRYTMSHPRVCTQCHAMPWQAQIHLDHIVPRRDGGTNADTNLQWLCHLCHARKRSQEHQARHPLIPKSPPGGGSILGTE